VSCAAQKTVKSVQIVENSFKSSYALDEKLSYSGAKILVTFEDGTTEVIGITSNMVSGFDSSTSGSQKKMTITYKSVSVNFTYNVVSSVNVDTAFRLTMSYVNDNNAVNVIVKSLSVEKVEGGLYAVSFNMTLTGCSFVSMSSLMGADWLIKHKMEGSMLKVILYSENGDVAVNASSDIVRVTLVKSADTSKVALSNIKMSNGIKDYIRIPTYTINL
jgi:hypothetical protein